MESSQNISIRELILNDSFFLTFFTFILSIIIWLPIAKLGGNHQLYFISIADYLMNPVTGWLETLNIDGLVNQAVGLVIVGLVFSIIGITGYIIKDNFFQERKYIGLILAFITVIYLYWGVTTFYLYHAVKALFIVNDFANFSGPLLAYICIFVLPLICIWYPFDIIIRLGIFTKTNPFINELTAYEKFKYFKDIYRIWIRKLMVPWLLVALVIIHTAVLINSV